MASGHASPRRGAGNKRSIIGLLGCSVGVGLALLSLRMLTVSQQAPASSPQRATPVQQTPSTKGPKLNIALGHAVLAAPELGFAVTGEDVSDEQKVKIRARLDSQLLPLRQLYQQESEQKPGLMGSVLLQLTVGPSGEVTQAKELGSRFLDTEFKKAILAEAGKWKFYEIVTQPVRITSALIFVREGMDITTLVEWEKELGSYQDKIPVVRNASQSVPQPKIVDNPAAKTVLPAAPVAPSEKQPPRPLAARPINVLEVKYPTAVRRDPNFGSPSLAQLTTGTKVAVLGTRGDWLEVRVRENDPSGFIRKEFVAPAGTAQRQ